MSDTTPDDPSRHVEQSAALRAALCHGREELFQTNVSFNTMVESFARMLPAMIDGLADEARRQEQTLLGIMERIQRGPLPGEASVVNDELLRSVLEESVSAEARAAAAIQRERVR